MCLGFLSFCLDLEVFAKIKKDLLSTHSLFAFLLTTQDLNKIKKKKKNPEHPFVGITKKETCAKFHQKILKFVAVGARQRFLVIRQIAWFLGNNRVLSKFRYGILYNLISITKL